MALAVDWEHGHLHPLHLGVLTPTLWLCRLVGSPPPGPEHKETIMVGGRSNERRHFLITRPDTATTVPMTVFGTTQGAWVRAWDRTMNQMFPGAARKSGATTVRLLNVAQRSDGLQLLTVRVGDVQMVLTEQEVSKL